MFFDPQLFNYENVKKDPKTHKSARKKQKKVILRKTERRRSVFVILGFFKIVLKMGHLGVILGGFWGQSQLSRIWE